MTTATLKDARMELKTTGETKELLAKAAAMSGVDMTAFVLGAAVERARDVIEDHSSIVLSLAGQRRFAELMANPPKPTEAMKKLAALSDLPERRG
ncbi:MAG: DUF1778 domain-containing protein [Ramlibacter sp.]|nr:DUF1778 domain-containing protein [Ramlibacter sp.]